jgi:hypothetical protein
MPAEYGHSKFLKPLKWLALAFGIKLILYLLFILPDNNPRRKFSGYFIRSADHNEYIRPIDNLIDKGAFVLDGDTQPYAGRLPGLFFPYVLFRIVCNDAISHILLGIFILGLSLLASYALGLLLLDLTKKRWAFICGFLFLNFIPFFWHFDWSLHTNSLGVSATVFFAYFFHHYLKGNNTRHLFYSGFMLAWIFFLRGFTLVFIPVCVLFLLFLLYKNARPIKQIFYSLLIFLTPLLIFESAWVTRNYISLHKFVPLQTSFVPGSDTKNSEYSAKMITKSSMMQVRKLIFAWGGDNTWYFKNADMAWFTREHSDIISGFNFDPNIFFDGFTPDSLDALKWTILYSYNEDLSKSSQDSIENVISTTANRYYEKFVTNKKAYFYFYSPLKRFNTYLLKNVTQDWPGPPFNKSSVLQRSFKLISLLQYFIFLLPVLIFPFFFFKYRTEGKHFGFFLLIYLLLLCNIIPFVTIIYMSHYSYFIFGYLFNFILLVFMINFILEKRKNTFG